jgi:hypothetical protein
VIKPLLVRSVCVDASPPLAGIPGALVHVDLAVGPVEPLVAVATVGAGLQSRV